MEVTLAQDLLSETLPRGVYEDSGEFTAWDQSKPYAPPLPTHILYDMWMDGEELKGIVELLVHGSEFGPVPERTATASVSFSGTEPGVYYCTFQTVSGLEDESESYGIGYVYELGKALRLSSESLYRFGKWRPEPQIYLEKTVYYATDTNAEKRAYTPGSFIYLDPYATIVQLYKEDAYGQLEDVPYYTYAVPHDPFPYWNPDMDIPEAVSSGAGKLDDSDIALLTYTEPVYRDTGDMETHALLSLYELGYLFGYLEDKPTALSWRSVPYNKIDTGEYLFEDAEVRRSLLRADQRTVVRRIVQELIAKAGW